MNKQYYKREFNAVVKTGKLKGLRGKAITEFAKEKMRKLYGNQSLCELEGD